jgi:hypothetical protein
VRTSSGSPGSSAVRLHRLGKLQVHSVAEAVGRAIRDGLV